MPGYQPSSVGTVMDTLEAPVVRTIVTGIAVVATLATACYLALPTRLSRFHRDVHAGDSFEHLAAWCKHEGVSLGRVGESSSPPCYVLRLSETHLLHDEDIYIYIYFDPANRISELKVSKVSLLP